MDTKTVYAAKAEKYARYRWDYAAQAIQAIFDITHVSSDGCIADIGAGTGILSRHFIGKVGHVFAVEPNDAMRDCMVKTLSAYPSCTILDSSAEATRLPDSSVDVITVAQAIHWFAPYPTRKELLRILKPEGWLAILRNYGTDEALGQAIGRLSTPENGVETVGHSRPDGKPVRFYYRQEHLHRLQRLIWPFEFQQDWQAFIGSLVSASYMPDEDHPLYKNFEAAAQDVFDRFSAGGWLTVHGETELWIG